MIYHLFNFDEMSLQPNGCDKLFFFLASSADVERVFSAAGRMHGDEQKNKVADTIKYSLFAHHNLKFGQ